MTTEYQHSALSSTRSIRILLLQPSNCGPDLQCTLEEVTLDDDPQYEALSYVWGAHDPDGNTNILCHGQRLTVTPNCCAALHRLRMKDTVRRLWIDAICIDQTSVKEKNHQVPLMGDVYQKSSDVILWLGEIEKKTASDVLMLALLGSMKIVCDQGIDPMSLSKLRRAIDIFTYDSKHQLYR
jgi:hypothetical protein